MGVGREQAGYLLTRMFTLAVCTVVGPDHVGHTSPSPKHMAARLRDDYDTFLRQVEATRPETAPTSLRSLEENRSFGALRDRARDLRPPDVIVTKDATAEAPLDAEPTLAEPQADILERIQHYSGQIDLILTGSSPRFVPESLGSSRRPSDELDQAPRKIKGEHVMALRRAYEIGTRPLELRTTVALDGDLVTQFTTVDGRPPNAGLQSFHSDVLGAALDQWRTMMWAVSAFVRLLVSLLSIALSQGPAGFKGWWRSRPTAQARPAARASHSAWQRATRFITSARDLFGRGGKCFETATTAGAAPLRTLIQPDGDMITTMPASAACDDQLLHLHGAGIVAWLHQFHADTRALLRCLDRGLPLVLGLAGLLGVGLKASDANDLLDLARHLATTTVLVLILNWIARVAARRLLRLAVNWPRSKWNQADGKPELTRTLDRGRSGG